jgi:CHAT domain-containing protein/tetratricopeptide (TPR) repeat protein
VHVFLPLAILLACSPCFAFDPVANFLAQVDSLTVTAADQAASGDEADASLAAYVSGHVNLVAAAVGQLIDRAIDGSPAAGGPGDAGRTEVAGADFALARRLAEIHAAETGSRVLLDLVAAYTKWGSDERARRREARQLEQEATAARTAGDPDRAIALLGQAMKTYESIDDKRSIAILWGTLGIAYWAKGDYEGAARQYENALAARRAIEDRILEGRTLNGLGSANYQLGKMAQALDYYQQAVALRTATGDTDGLATSMTYLGNAYIAAGRTLEARKTLEQALPVVDETGNTAQRYELLTSIASLNADMGRTTSANEALAEALELAQAMGDPKREMICRNNLARNFAYGYRYDESLEQLEVFRVLLDEHPDPEMAIVFHGTRGIVNMRIGELESARADFMTLLDLGEKHQMAVLQLEALLNLGYLSDNLGVPEEGVAYAEHALALARDIANPRMEHEALILAGQLERNLGMYEASAARWEAALALDEPLSRGEGDSLGFQVAQDQVGLASVYVLAGRSEEARAILGAAQAAVERSRDGDLIVAAAFCMGHSFEKSHPESARFYYERGLDLLEKARAEVGGTEIRTGYLGGLRWSYFTEVATYYAGLAWGTRSDGGGGAANRGEPAQWSALAFRTIERAKARGLLDMLDASISGSTSSAEEALLDSLYALNPGLPDYAEREQQLKESYAALREERVVSSGGHRAQTEVVGPDEIRKALPGGTALLEYALGDTMSLVWLVDRDGFVVRPLPKRAAIEDAVARLRDAIAHPMLGDEALRRTAREIYVAVVSPFDDRLKKVKDLVVVPDGILFELPFEVLLSEEPAPGLAWADLPYLARRHSITYAPSASTYLALRGRPAPGGKDPKALTDLVAMGDPAYTLLEPLPRLRAPLQPLPHARTEIAGIARILKDKNVDAYVGPEADEAVLKAHLRDHAVRVVHLATHGIVDRAEPIASSIALCPDPAGTEDGYLRTLEVMSLPMDVGLVVLSACESARGEIARGEGVVGFGRAFLAAGARTIVASLWAVSDQSTAILMEAFYRQLTTRKQPVGRALNEARFSLMADPRYSHPYYWSPFVVMGCKYKPW